MAKLSILFILLILFIFSGGSVASSQSGRKTKSSLSKVTSMQIIRNKEVKTAAPKRRLMEESELTPLQICEAKTGCDPDGDLTDCPKHCDECLPDDDLTFCSIAETVPVYSEVIYGQDFRRCEEITGCDLDPNAQTTGCPKRCQGCEQDEDDEDVTYCTEKP